MSEWESGRVGEWERGRLSKFWLFAVVALWFALPGPLLADNSDPLSDFTFHVSRFTFHGLRTTAYATSTIVLNEIHYHAASEAYGEEYVELYNAGSTVADLSGWYFSDGFDYTFPTGTVMLPGDYRVVASDPALVEAIYGITGTLGPFASGRLDNSGERIALADPTGVVADQVTYDDHLPWPEAADGDGPSLELINPTFNHESPCSWGASVGAGTPGAQNSVYHAGNLPPCILAPTHAPLLPTSTQPVTVTAFVDDNSVVVSVTLYYRVQGEAAYTAVPMRQEAGGKKQEARSTPYSLLLTPYSAIIPSLAISETIFLPGQGRYVEFYITATDDEGATRIMPEGAPGGTSAETGLPLTVSFLYWVEDVPLSSNLLLYRLILTDQNRAELTTRDMFSNELLDATFVCSDTAYYNVGLRYRGDTRNFTPRPYRIKFRDAQEFESRERLNLLSDNLDRDAMAYSVFQRAGLPASDTRFVQLAINGRVEGNYLDVEAVDRDFLKAHFGDDDDGNLYRGAEGADLAYRGADPNLYRPNYVKKTNEEADDFTDVISLTYALTHAPDATFMADAEAVADMRQWLKWFAVQAVLDNHEGALWIGGGDDYYLYHRGGDDRFVLLSWDHDTTFVNPTHTIWEPDWYAKAAVKRILHTPVFMRWYYQGIAEVITGPFSVAEMFPRIDALPAEVVGAGDKQELKDFVGARVPYLWTEIPDDTLVILTNNGDDIVTTDATVTLEGMCSPLRDVTVNGSADGVTYLTATSWRYVAQLPQRDNVFVFSDGVDTQTIAVFRDVFHGGTLTADTVLESSRLPYTIYEDIRLSGGVTLTIEGGATLRFDAERLIRVEDGARLWIHGTVTQPVVLSTGDPALFWGGILLWNTRADNRIEYAVLEYIHEVLLNPRTHGVTAFASDIAIAHSTLRHMRHSVAVTADYDSALTLLYNEIYDIGTDAVHATGGQATIEGNTIHDSFYDLSFNPSPPEGIEISAIQNPPAVLRDNRIYNITDDCLDANDSSVIVERNIFHHCGDKGISIGGPFSSTLVNNLVYECRYNEGDYDHTGFGVALKDGATAFLANNTLVSNTHGLGLFEMHAGDGGATATGINTIIWGNEQSVVTRDGSSLTLVYSHVGGGFPGEGNSDADPLFRAPLNHVYRLKAESPCVDTGTPVGAPDMDVVRIARPKGEGYDRGAFEFFEFYTVYLPMVLR